VSAATILRLEVDCHAYAWHEPHPDYTECGPDNLVRMAETYGVLVRHLPEHAWADWAYWYEIIGPYEHIVRLLTDEYTGDEEAARDMADCATAWQRIPTKENEQ